MRTQTQPRMYAATLREIRGIIGTVSLRAVGSGKKILRVQRPLHSTSDSVAENIFKREKNQPKRKSQPPAYRRRLCFVFRSSSHPAD